MYLVAIGWMFVVVLMAGAEAMSPVGTVLGAAFTLLLYGALPLSIVLYLMGTPARRRARRAREGANGNAPLSGTALDPDQGRHAPGHAIAAEREEP